MTALSGSWQDRRHWQRLQLCQQSLSLPVIYHSSPETSVTPVVSSWHRMERSAPRFECIREVCQVVFIWQLVAEGKHLRGCRHSAGAVLSWIWTGTWMYDDCRILETLQRCRLIFVVVQRVAFSVSVWSCWVLSNWLLVGWWRSILCSSSLAASS